MKIIVDEMPEKETDCLFHEITGQEPFTTNGCSIDHHICSLHSYGCSFLKQQYEEDGDGE